MILQGKERIDEAVTCVDGRGEGGGWKTIGEGVVTCVDQHEP